MTDTTLKNRTVCPKVGRMATLCVWRWPEHWYGCRANPVVSLTICLPVLCFQCTQPALAFSYKNKKAPTNGYLASALLSAISTPGFNHDLPVYRKQTSAIATDNF